MNPFWRDVVIGKYYAAWPFVEYGECLGALLRRARSRRGNDHLRDSL